MSEEMPGGLGGLASSPRGPVQVSTSLTLTDELENGPALPQAFPPPHSAFLSQGEWLGTPPCLGAPHSSAHAPSFCIFLLPSPVRQIPFLD